MSPYRKSAREIREPTWRDQLDKLFSLLKEIHTSYRERKCVGRDGHGWVVSRRWVFGAELYPTSVEDFAYDATCFDCGRKIFMFEKAEIEILNLIRKKGVFREDPDPKVQNFGALAVWNGIPTKIRAASIRGGVLLSGSGYLKRPHDHWSYPRNPKGWKGFPEVEEFAVFGESTRNVRSAASWKTIMNGFKV